MRLHVAINFGFEFGHVFATSHQIGDLFTTLLAFAKVSGLGSADQNREVIANRQSVYDVVRNKNDRDALLASLKDNAQHMRRLLDA